VALAQTAKHPFWQEELIRLAQELPAASLGGIGLALALTDPEEKC
jgi:hypothetical protein